MSLWNTFKEKVLRREVAAVIEANEESGEHGTPFVPNRRMRRAYKFGPDNRMRGSGYTRAYRKGRTQRERDA